jgi:protocatechuate 3,4-dioxygenase beta subunit
MSETDSGEHLGRRRAIASLVGVGGALAFGCGTQSGASGASSDGSTETGADTGAQEAGDCQATPEGEIGPYFADDSAAGFNRSDTLSNLDGTSTQPGVPLTLTITVVDTERGCAAYSGVQVDIWHCNASGVYSDIDSEGTASDQWLRAYQVTDSAGHVTFQTIIPGWYSGRTTHIHLRVRSSYSDASSTTDESNTTQCFFDQTFIDMLYTTVAPYSARGANPTTNAGDHVFAGETNGANVLALTGDTPNGFAASLTIRLPITSTYDAATAGPPGGGPPGDGGPPPGEGGPPPGDAGQAPG